MFLLSNAEMAKKKKKYEEKMEMRTFSIFQRPTRPQKEGEEIKIPPLATSHWALLGTSMEPRRVSYNSARRLQRAHQRVVVVVTVIVVVVAPLVPRHSCLQLELWTTKKKEKKNLTRWKVFVW